MTLLYDNFKTNTRRVMTVRGVTLDTLARASGYSRSYLQRIFNGQKQNPSVGFVETIAATLRVGPLVLLGGNDMPQDRNNRISLKADLNHKMFKTAMDTLRDNKLQLTDYDSRLFRDLEDGYDMFGRDLAITVKQMNHIKQVAFDLEKGC